MKTLIVTEWCPRYQEVADVALPNMYEYAQIHGYDCHEIKMSNEDRFHYKKHEVFKEVFEKDEYGLIFYRDIDAIITNLSVPIETFIDDVHGLFICEDSLVGVNGGSLIIKNNDKGKWVNDFILSEREKFNNEQVVMEYYKNSLQKTGYMKILPYPSINSYPYEMYPEFQDRLHEQSNWKEGHFLLHTPALPYEKRAEVLRNAKIIR